MDYFYRLRVLGLLLAATLIVLVSMFLGALSGRVLEPDMVPSTHSDLGVAVTPSPY